MKKFENYKCIWIDISKKKYIVFKNNKIKQEYKSYKDIETVLKISLNKGLPIYIVSGTIKKCFYTSPYPLIFSIENKKSHKLINNYRGDLNRTK